MAKIYFDIFVNYKIFTPFNSISSLNFFIISNGFITEVLGLHNALPEVMFAYGAIFFISDSLINSTDAPFSLPRTNRLSS